jgi:hypothetical protein
MMKQHKETLDRFGLFDGQFFAHYKFKNLQWYLGDCDRTPINSVNIGYGDLRGTDLIRIMDTLTDGEVFTGYSEVHGYDHCIGTQPCERRCLLVTITSKRITLWRRGGAPHVTWAFGEEGEH